MATRRGDGLATRAEGGGMGGGVVTRLLQLAYFRHPPTCQPPDFTPPPRLFAYFTPPPRR